MFDPEPASQILLQSKKNTKQVLKQDAYPHRPNFLLVRTGSHHCSKDVVQVVQQHLLLLRTLSNEITVLHLS